MVLTLKRLALLPEYTIGKLYIDGTFFCDTLEDEVRDFDIMPKVYGKTAIPYGIYKVIVSESPKFKRLLPRLLDVPHFDGILIHRGNTAEDSAGCILIGENSQKGKVLNSTKYEQKLVELLKVEKDIKIEII
jgi:hypothetical protein